MKAAEPGDVTAKTVTDEQIRELRRQAEREIGKQWPNEAASNLLFVTAAALYRNADQSDGNGTWTKWREACAAAINARAKGTR